MLYEIEINQKIRVISTNHCNYMIEEMRRIFKDKSPTIYTPITIWKQKEHSLNNNFTLIINSKSHQQFVL